VESPNDIPNSTTVFGLDDRKAFMNLVLKPLQDKVETLYVLPDAPRLTQAAWACSAVAGNSCIAS
jgi:hypothetical protein